MNKLVSWFLIVLGCFLIVASFSYGLTPQSDFYLRGFYSFYDFFNVNASGNISTLDNFCLRGTCISSWPAGASVDEAGLQNNITTLNLTVAGLSAPDVGGLQKNITTLNLSLDLKMNVSGGNFTGDVEVPSRISLGQYLQHQGDGDTYVSFNTDSINFYAGGVLMMNWAETVQDVIGVNPLGSADIDFYLGTNDLFYRGSDGFIGIQTTSPGTELDVNGDLTVRNGLISQKNVTLSNLKSCNIETDSNGRMICGVDDGGEADLSGVQANITTLNVSMATHIGLEGNVSAVETLIGVVGLNLTSVNNSILSINGSLNYLEHLIGLVGINVSLVSAGDVDFSGLQANITTLNLTYGSLIGEVGLNLSSLNSTVDLVRAKHTSVTGNISNVNTAITNNITSVHSGIEANNSLIYTLIGAVGLNITSINNSILSINGSIDFLQTLIGVVAANITSSSADLSGVQKNITTLNLTLPDLIGRVGYNVTTLNNSLADLDTRVGAVGINVSSLNLTVDEVRAKHAGVEGNVSSVHAGIEANLTAVYTTIGYVGLNTSTLNVTLADLDTKVGEVAANITSGDVDVSGLQKNITTLNLTFGDLIGIVALNLSSLNSTVDLVRAKHSSVDGNISNLNVAVTNNVTNLNAAITNNISTLDTKVGGLGLNISTLNTTIAGLSAPDVGGLQKNITTLNLTYGSALGSLGLNITSLNNSLVAAYTLIGAVGLNLTTLSAAVGNVALNLTNLNLTYGSALGSHGINISTLNITYGTLIGAVGSNVSSLRTDFTTSLTNLNDTKLNITGGNVTGSFDVAQNLRVYNQASFGNNSGAYTVYINDELPGNKLWVQGPDNIIATIRSTNGTPELNLYSSAGYSELMQNSNNMVIRNRVENGLLQLYGTNGVGLTEYFRVDPNAGTDDTMSLMMSGGLVGIGTAIPATALHVAGQRIRIESATDPGLEIKDGSRTVYSFIDTSDNTFELQAGAANQLALSGTNAYVGINTSTPSQTLHVVGDLNVTKNGFVGGTRIYTKNTTHSCISFGTGQLCGCLNAGCA